MPAYRSPVLLYHRDVAVLYHHPAGTVSLSQERVDMMPLSDRKSGVDLMAPCESQQPLDTMSR